MMECVEPSDLVQVLAVGRGLGSTNCNGGAHIKGCEHSMLVGHDRQQQQARQQQSG